MTITKIKHSLITCILSTEETILLAHAVHLLLEDHTRLIDPNIEHLATLESALTATGIALLSQSELNAPQHSHLKTAIAASNLPHFPC